MRRRRLTAVGLLLCLPSSLAWAHGIEGFLQALGITGAAIGLVTGIAAALLRYKFVIGLLASVALLILGGVAFIIPELGEASMEDIGVMVLWLSLFSGLPLLIAFSIAFAATTNILRERDADQKGKGEAAP